MTHIIKAPKPPRRGPTFGDVPEPKELCTALLTIIVERHCTADSIVQLAAYRDPETPAVDVRRALGKLVERGLVTVGAEWSLTVQPVTPEPDPDVCTYGDLEPGEWFSFVEVPNTLCVRLREGYQEAIGGREFSGGAPEHVRVRRAHVTIVEHEEPGTALTQCLGGSIRVTRGQLAAIVRQGAAFLAQQATSPESGEPRGDRNRQRDRIVAPILDLLCHPHDAATKGGES